VSVGDPRLVSAVIPVRDGERFLAEAIASIRAQDHAAIEIIVVDDGSRDGSAAVAAGLGGVRVIRQENAGPAAARNAGIAAARGDVLGFLDADDLWTPGRLAPMLARLAASPPLDVVLGHTRRVAADGSFADTAPPALLPYSIGAALYRRRVFERVGLFDPTLRFGEDQDWFLRARELGVAIAVLDEVTEIKRKHDANMMRGKTLIELNLPTVLKRALDRRRARRES
jgi:glycosyltransferase involved in cell wall biosynthesis